MPGSLADLGDAVSQTPWDLSLCACSQQGGVKEAGRYQPASLRPCRSQASRSALRSHPCVALSSAGALRACRFRPRKNNDQGLAQPQIPLLLAHECPVLTAHSSCFARATTHLNRTFFQWWLRRASSSAQRLRSPVLVQNCPQRLNRVCFWRQADSTAPEPIGHPRRAICW